MSIFALAILVIVAIVLLSVLSSAPFFAAMNPTARWAINAVVVVFLCLLVLEWLGMIPGWRYHR